MLLAAGQGSRWKAAGGQAIASHKLLAPLKDSRVIDLALARAFASGLEIHACIRTDTPAEIKEVLTILATQVHVMPKHYGMGDVIAAGVSATSHASGWLILPADMPLLSRDSIRSVATALKDHTLVVPQYQGQSGHPVGFSKNCRTALTALAGDTGAKTVVQAHVAAQTPHYLKLDDAGILLDIDTPEDLHRASTFLPNYSGGPTRPSI